MKFSALALSVKRCCKSFIKARLLSFWSMAGVFFPEWPNKLCRGCNRRPPRTEFSTIQRKNCTSVSVRFFRDLKDKILDDYLQEMPWQEGLIDDHFRYFAFFLRTRFPSHQNWQEVFICEWCRWSRSYLDLPWSEKPEKTRAQGFELNPSLQFYRLGTEAAGFLETEAGLYACFYQAEARKTRDHKVQKEQARALDLLEEEMGFSREKILQVLTEDLKSAEIAEATLHSLQTLGVLR
jgi:hypothetical protein